MKSASPKIGLAALLGACLLFANGCSTAATVIGGAKGNFDCDPQYKIPRIYSGVANDVRFVRDGSESCGLAALDLPFSFVADTVVLPYTLVTQSKYGDLSNKQAATKRNNLPDPNPANTDR